MYTIVTDTAEASKVDSLDLSPVAPVHALGVATVVVAVAVVVVVVGYNISAVPQKTFLLSASFGSLTDERESTYKNETIFYFCHTLAT
jgi:hypothetical protein